MRRVLLLLALVASPVLAKTDKPVPVCSEPIKPVLFLSPMGEPFRPKGDGDEPAKRWFEQADANHDGSLTVGELMLDAGRFFDTLDKDRNGELLPDEVHAYEEDVAPEIRLYQRRVEREPGKEGAEEARPKRQKKPKRNAVDPFDGVIGAGRWSLRNIPNPVASADDDINRAISHKEFLAAAAERFRDLDAAQNKALMFAQLPKTPAQLAANLACLERVKDAKETRK
jgi:hypothetical protein